MMKTIYSIAICLMAATMPSLAQQSDSDISTLHGAELADCLNDPTAKAQYIRSLNKIAENSEECKKWGVSLMDLSIDKNIITDSTSTDSVRNGMHKASIMDASTGNYHNTYKIRYITSDGKNNNIYASAVIYTDDSADAFKFGLLSCHPTVTSISECPTGPNAPEAAISAMGDEECMVVCPDYCGYGLTSNIQHPYLIQDVTARNCIDAYLAAYAYMKEVENHKFESSFFTLFIGYSQGGSVAMACQKLCETGKVYDETDIEKINLRHTYCGDGPYSPVATINQYLYWANQGKKLAYPCVLPLILMAAMDAYDDDCMHTVKYEDFFTKEFLQTGITDLIKGKKMQTDEINYIVWANNLTSLDQMLSDKIIIKDANTDTLKFNTESNEYKCLMRSLQKNDLTKGWVPSHKITFFHFKDDMVVPYANRNAVYDLVKNGTWSSSYVDFKDAKDAYSDGGTWYKLVKWAKVNDALKVWDHVSVGTLFYCWFMFHLEGSRSE